MGASRSDACQPCSQPRDSPQQQRRHQCYHQCLGQCRRPWQYPRSRRNAHTPDRGGRGRGHPTDRGSRCCALPASPHQRASDARAHTRGRAGAGESAACLGGGWANVGGPSLTHKLSRSRRLNVSRLYSCYEQRHPPNATFPPRSWFPQGFPMMVSPPKPKYGGLPPLFLI